MAVKTCPDCHGSRRLHDPNCPRSCLDCRAGDCTDPNCPPTPHCGDVYAVDDVFAKCSLPITHGGPHRQNDMVWQDPAFRGAHDRGPAYYKSGDMQPWDVIDAFQLDYWLGTCVKYILRAGRKPGSPKLEDLKKAEHFIQKAIEKEEKA